MVIAARRARASGGSFYEEAGYGMTARSHRRFALFSGIFALLFLAGTIRAVLPTLPLLAIFTVFAILYGASFVRGSTGEDE